MSVFLDSGLAGDARAPERRSGCIFRSLLVFVLEKFIGSNNLLSRRKCLVPEDWRDSGRLWQAVGLLKERLLRVRTQLVPVVHRRDPRDRAATATSPAARRAGGPCGPTGASVTASRSRRRGRPIEGSAG